MSKCAMLPRGLSVGFVPLSSYDVMLKYHVIEVGAFIHKPASCNKPSSADVNSNTIWETYNTLIF